jgi:hypothetical protein
MRLLHNGRAADWAAGFVHADVMHELECQCLDAPPGGAIIRREFFMMLIAGPEWGTFGRTPMSPNGFYAIGESVAASVDAKPDPFQSHHYLQKLEQKAIAQVKQLFAEVREQLKPAQRRRNPGLHAKRKNDIRLLYKFLRGEFLEYPEEFPPRPSLANIAKDVGVDLPSYESVFG